MFYRTKYTFAADDIHPVRVPLSWTHPLDFCYSFSALQKSRSVPVSRIATADRARTTWTATCVRATQGLVKESVISVRWFWCYSLRSWQQCSPSAWPISYVQIDTLGKPLQESTTPCSIHGVLSREWCFLAGLPSGRCDVLLVCSGWQSWVSQVSSSARSVCS